MINTIKAKAVADPLNRDFVIQGEKCRWDPSLLPGDEVCQWQRQGGDGVHQQVLADAERGRDRRHLPWEGDAEVSPHPLPHLRRLSFGRHVSSLPERWSPD